MLDARPETLRRLQRARNPYPSGSFGTARMKRAIPLAKRLADRLKIGQGSQMRTICPLVSRLAWACRPFRKSRDEWPRYPSGSTEATHSCHFSTELNRLDHGMRLLPLWSVGSQLKIPLINSIWLMRSSPTISARACLRLKDWP